MPPTMPLSYQISHLNAFCFYISMRATGLSHPHSFNHQNFFSPLSDLSYELLDCNDLVGEVNSAEETTNPGNVSMRFI
jgi:hypothetical protein